MSEEALKQFNKLNEHDKKEVMNLIRYKNEYKYQQLQQRIDKSIAYIKECTSSPDYYENFISSGEAIILLKILEGDK